MTDVERASELNNRGYDLAETGRWEEAIPYYERAVKNNPKHVNAWTNLGNALQALGRLDEALTCQEKACSLDPDNCLAWANKAVVLSGLGRKPEAITCYERSLQLDPKNKITWFNKGCALLALGDHAQALQCFDHILASLDPRMKNAWGAKSEVLRVQGKPEEADSCLQTIAELDADPRRFSFAETSLDLNLFGEEIDSRKFLRGFEAALREQSGIHQIQAHFTSSAFAAADVVYSPESGYEVRIPPATLVGGSLKSVEADVVKFVQKHSRANGVASAPPPIPRTSVRVESSIDFDTRSRQYEALAHDGGWLLAFYREKASHAAALQRHVPPTGVVHYRFARDYDYLDLKIDAAAFCSAFLDLSFIDDEDMSKDTLRMFLSEHGLYSWGSEGR